MLGHSSEMLGHSSLMPEDYCLMLEADSGQSYTENFLCIQTKIPAGIIDCRQGFSVTLNSCSERLF